MTPAFALHGIPVSFDPWLDDGAQWSARAFAYEEPIDIVPLVPLFFSGLRMPPVEAPRTRTRLVADPGFFVLAAALNIAAAYRPDGVP